MNKNNRKRHTRSNKSQKINFKNNINSEKKEDNNNLDTESNVMSGLDEVQKPLYNTKDIIQGINSSLKSESIVSQPNYIETATRSSVQSNPWCISSNNIKSPIINAISFKDSLKYNTINLGSSVINTSISDHSQIRWGVNNPNYLSSSFNNYSQPTNSDFSTSPSWYNHMNTNAMLTSIGNNFSNTKNLKEWYENILPINDNNTKGEVIELKKKLKDAISKHKDLLSKNESLVESENEIRKLHDQLVDKENKVHIVSRIHDEYYKQLINADLFFKGFDNSTGEDTVVISIDIRRSTDLMLKASAPEKFVDFITGLTKKLSDCVKLNFGVFDRFTGDGILAFFPNFYSDKYAILFAIRTAVECHKIFLEHYNAHQNSFDVFIEDIGLGIGIEFGKVAIVTTNKELTIVGKPVVYACRYSDAKAGDTLLGVKAIQKVTSEFINLVDFEQSTIPIKNEGNARVYKILNLRKFDFIPDWSELKNITPNEQKQMKEI